MQRAFGDHALEVALVVPCVFPEWLHAGNRVGGVLGRPAVSRFLHFADDAEPAFLKLNQVAKVVIRSTVWLAARPLQVSEAATMLRRATVEPILDVWTELAWLRHAATLRQFWRTVKRANEHALAGRCGDAERAARSGSVVSCGGW